MVPAQPCPQLASPAGASARCILLSRVAHAVRGSCSCQSSAGGRRSGAAQAARCHCRGKPALPSRFDSRDEPSVRRSPSRANPRLTRTSPRNTVRFVRVAPLHGRCHRPAQCVPRALARERHEMRTRRAACTSRQPSADVASPRPWPPARPCARAPHGGVRAAARASAEPSAAVTAEAASRGPGRMRRASLWRRASPSWLISWRVLCDRAGPPMTDRR